MPDRRLAARFRLISSLKHSSLVQNTSGMVPCGSPRGREGAAARGLYARAGLRPGPAARAASPPPRRGGAAAAPLPPLAGRLPSTPPSAAARPTHAQLVVRQLHVEEGVEGGLGAPGVWDRPRQLRVGDTCAGAWRASAWAGRPGSQRQPPAPAGLHSCSQPASRLQPAPPALPAPPTRFLCRSSSTRLSQVPLRPHSAGSRPPSSLFPRSSTRRSSSQASPA